MAKMIINNAIMHSISKSSTLMSAATLDIDSETCINFISKHVGRLFTSPSARTATFHAESEVYPIASAFRKGDIRFVDMSLQLGTQLADLLLLEDDVPQGVILFVDFIRSNRRYLTIHHILCQECYTQRIVHQEDKSEVYLSVHPNVLPLPSRKQDAVLIPLEDEMILRTICREDSDFFVESFLGCEWELSRQETVGIIADAAEIICEKHFGNNPDAVVAVKQAIIDKAPDKGEDTDGSFSLKSAAKQAFPDRPEIAEEFVQLAEEAGLPLEPNITKDFAARQLGRQKIRGTNGIVVELPIEIAQNPDAVMIEQHSDGSIDIRIKRLQPADK